MSYSEMALAFWFGLMLGACGTLWLVNWRIIHQRYYIDATADSAPPPRGNGD